MFPLNGPSFAVGLCVFLFCLVSLSWSWLTCQSPHLYLPSTGVTNLEPPHLVFIFLRFYFCVCVRACLNIRVPHVRWALELQLIVSCHAGAGIGCSFSEPTPEQVLRQVRSLSLPATPLVGFHSSAPAHTPFLGKSTEGSSIQFLPELQTSSQPGLCVASGQTATGCASYTGRLGWPAGDRQWEAWAGRNAASARSADIHLGNSSGQQVLPPRLLGPPQPPPPVPWCFKKTQRKRGRV